MMKTKTFLYKFSKFIWWKIIKLGNTKPFVFWLHNLWMMDDMVYFGCIIYGWWISWKAVFMVFQCDIVRCHCKFFLIQLLNLIFVAMCCASRLIDLCNFGGACFYFLVTFLEGLWYAISVSSFCWKSFL